MPNPVFGVFKKIMTNNENESQNGSQNEVRFDVRPPPGTVPGREKTDPPKRERNERPKVAPREPKWSKLDPKLYPNNTGNIPMVIGLITGRKWTSKCTALLLLAPLGPQTSLCASIRPPFFPSTSCPHRFPLGAAVSRSAYNALWDNFGTHFQSFVDTFLEPSKPRICNTFPHFSLF